MDMGGVMFLSGTGLVVGFFVLMHVMDRRAARREKADPNFLRVSEPTNDPLTTRHWDFQLTGGRDDTLQVWLGIADAAGWGGHTASNHWLRRRGGIWEARCSDPGTPDGWTLLPELVGNAVEEHHQRHWARNGPPSR